MHPVETAAAPAAQAAPDPRRSPARGRIGVALAGCWLALVVLGAAASSLLPALDPLRADFSAILEPPSAKHWLGTDAIGRDILARTLAGGRSSLIVGAMTVAFGLVAGGLLGIAAGYLRGVVDGAVGILTDLILAFPALILIMAVVSLSGAGYWTIGLLIGGLSVPAFARLARASTISVREQDYVLAARNMGAGPLRTMRTEIIPNVLPVLGAYSFAAVTASIVVEGSLSFLGFGLQPPLPSWGNLIAEGRVHFATAPWITAAPALTLCATVLSVNVLGQALSKGRP
ncbi:ABC transporter permease [Nocardiopsis sp. CNT-189]|uniref:ABC transporter permease n=1 Tax=Nocardiopsis oceanisediminis TaxID=2816862 RepID=UPI003B2AFF16